MSFCLTLLHVFNLEGRTMVVSVDSTTTVDISRAAGEPACEVCSVDESTRDCGLTEKTLTSVENLSLEFGCPKPENVYTVMIMKNIGKNYNCVLVFTVNSHTVT